MEFVLEENTLILKPEGVIDSNNSDAIGKEFDEIRNNNPHELLVLDLAKLKYISSAGLRIILKLKKTSKNFKIINVISEVYEIFDMTGFSEMMSIEKAYREISIEGCEVIGEGSNGIVYRISPDQIIKVYKNPDALDDIKRERELARKALVLGINTAISYDVVKVGDKYGSVFELLDSKSLTKLINEDKSKLQDYVKIFADILKDIHKTEVKDGSLPSAKQIAMKWVVYLCEKIPQDTYDKLYKLVDGVKESNYLIHGDYHTSNLHYANGEAILIDMDTIAVGNPLFDFSSIFLAFKAFGELDRSRIENFLKIDFDTANTIWTELLKNYLNTNDEKVLEEAENKAKVLGYTRLLRRTFKREPQNQALIDKTTHDLIEVVNKVNSVSF